MSTRKACSIDNFRLVERGRLREAEILKVLTDHPYPCRNPTQNLADLRAQIAANEMGVREVRKMVEHFGLDVVRAYMGHVQDNAAESVRRVIEALHDSEFAVETDQGAMIKVKISVDRDKREATVDFTGTSPRATDQLQRARTGHPRRDALLLPRHGRGRHPDECRLPAADPHRPARRLDAVAALSGRGRRRQCRDLAGRHRLPLRRARRHGLGAGHHEQPHLRQREAISITRRSAPAPPPAA